MSLFPTLKRIAEIKSITISNYEGVALIHEGASSPDDIAATSVVIAQKISHLGELVSLGAFASIVLQGEDTTVLVPREDQIACATVLGKTDGQKLISLLDAESWLSSTTQPTSNTPLAKPISRQPLPATRKTTDAVKSVPAKIITAKQVPIRHTIPATPAARTMKQIRLSLFSGDLFEAKSLCPQIAEFHFYSDSTRESIFVGHAKQLCELIGKLLKNVPNTMAAMDEFVAKSEHKENSLDNSLHWAALIWQIRLLLCCGKVKKAIECARSAYHLAHEFDSASRVATRCVIANVYMMSGEKLDEALKVVKSSRSIALRSRSDLMVGAMALVEAQVLAMQRKYFQSSDAAKRALVQLPDSPYPKIMMARSAILRKQYVQARQLYEEILLANSTQPDALTDLQILAAVESKAIDLEDVSIYFEHKELTPTSKRVSALKAVLKRQPDFVPLRNLLVWRLNGIGDVKSAQFIYQSDTSDEHLCRFKPNVVIGYASSAVIAAGYCEVGAYLGALNPADAITTSSLSEFPIPRLSLPSEDILQLVESDMTENIFSGELKAFSMPDLLEFLRNGQRTGSLLCSSVHGVGAIELEDGFISSAVVPDVDNIGSLLLASGKVTKRELIEAVEAQEKDISGMKIGAILVERGIVDAQSIKDAIIEQTFSAVRVMLGWENGRFVFTPNNSSRAFRSGLKIRVDSQYLLMELFRQLDEANR